MGTAFFYIGKHPKAADLQVTKKSHEVIREIFYISERILNAD